MDRKEEHNEEAGSSRESKPTTQRIPGHRCETGDVEDAAVEKQGVAERVERIEKGELTQQAHTSKPRGAKQLKPGSEKKKKTSTKEKGVDALVAKYVAELKEKEEQLEKSRLEIAKLKRDQSRAVPSMSAKAKKWTEDDENSTDSEELSSGDREPYESEDETEEEEMPLTRRQESARKRLSMELPPFDGSPEVWPIFISCFEDTTKACAFSNLENLQRLRKSLRGDALEAVRGTMMLPDSVPDMIKELRNLFGRPRRILKALLHKVQTVPAPNADRLETFITFGSAVKQLVGHIVGAKLTEHLSNPLLVEELEEKLPPSYQLDWVRYKRHRRGKTLQVFSSYLTALIEDITEVKDFGSRTTTRTGLRTSTRANLNHHAVENGDLKKCYVCNSTSHKVRECNEFKLLSVPGRLEHVEKNSLCKNCLNNHGRAMCRFRRVCGIEGCNDRHHPLLHQPSTDVGAACNTHWGKYRSTIFRTMPVTLSAGDRTYETVAFLDEGASGTFVEDDVAKALGIRGVNEPLVVSWSADVERREDKSRKIDVVLSTRSSAESFLLNGARTVEKLVLPSQRESFHHLQQRYPHLSGVPIEEAKDKPVRILLGLDNLHLFAPMESKIGKPGEPIAVRSKIGWSIYGPKSTVSDKVYERITYHNIVPVTNEELHDVLRSQYTLENCGVNESKLPLSKEDRRANEILQATTVRIGDRFETGLLWKHDEHKFPPSFEMAKKRLEGLKRKMAKDKDLEKAIFKMIQEYEAKKYAHKLTVAELNESDPASVWYLPLNVVTNPNKPGKIRLVWDAAATVRGVSLNSELLTGPDMLCSLPSVICPFREGPVGFGGDIKEMYHQIAIRREDKQAQRFLFPDPVNGEPMTYVMDVATFGSTCSPCSAQFVKNKNADEYADEFPEACDAIKNRHYVDDYFDSADTVEEAVKLAKQVRYVHSKGGFHIRNWVGNGEGFSEEMGEWRPAQTIQFRERYAEGTAKVDRVLGIMWNVKDDTFQFRPPFKAHEFAHPSKRMVVSCVMSLFDPMGYLSPFIVVGKMLVQDLWRTGCDWDEPIDESSLNNWESWRVLMPKIETIKIPRAYFGDASSKQIRELQLHVFTDASQSAYGCVAYFRALFDDGVKCSLIMGRHKVAPVKARTIPQLELCAAVLGARLTKTVKQLHRVAIAKQFIWCDSRTVLSWIRSDQYRYKPYVNFRIGEILELTRVMDWHWVPSKANVADKLTKTSKEWCFETQSVWLNGPEFLHRDESEWPQQPHIEANTEEGLRAMHLFHEITLQKQFIDVSRISKWTVLVRTVASVIRFISNCRRKIQHKEIETLTATKKQLKHIMPVERKIKKVPLKQEEHYKAECVLIKVAQAECFADELKVLRRNTSLPEADWIPIEKSSLLYRLTPMIDHEGIIRIEGRTMNCDILPFDLRFPIILPKDHDISKKIIQLYHEKHGHAFREAVKNDLRQRYYIANVNAVLRKVSASCAWCKVNRNRPETPRMAPLPNERLSNMQRPFSSVGVDYFGPIEVVVGRSRQKRWIVLFTCLVVRAVHLEVAHDLSASSCLMAIRRFVCRRGTPSQFISDNGTNLKAASKEIVDRMKVIDEECAEKLTDARTSWRFIPPGTPHMGGSWERLVRTVKATLLVLQEGARLTDEILQTSIAEAEDMVNSRPLTYVADESSDALCPNNFLRGVSANEHHLVPTPTDPAEALRDKYRRSQMYAEHLWQRFVKEYLPTINKRGKWFKESRILKKGDLVYIVEGKNRKQWVRGTVEETILSRDGRCRQAWVKTASGLFKRGTCNLAVLDIK